MSHPAFDTVGEFQMCACPERQEGIILSVETSFANGIAFKRDRKEGVKIV